MGQERPWHRSFCLCRLSVFEVLMVRTCVMCQVYLPSHMSMCAWVFSGGSSSSLGSDGVESGAWCEMKSGAWLKKTYLQMRYLGTQGPLRSAKLHQTGLSEGKLIIFDQSCIEGIWHQICIFEPQRLFLVVVSLSFSSGHPCFYCLCSYCRFLY